MRKILIFLSLLVSVSFSSDFDKNFNYLKSKFLKMTPNQVVEFLCLHTKRNSPYNKTYVSLPYYGYSYNYSCNKEEYIIDFRPYQNNIDIKNYKKLNKFVEDIKYRINKTICKDPVFKASLHSNIRLHFKIYDSRGSLQSKFTYNKNSSPACTFY